MRPTYKSVIESMIACNASPNDELPDSMLLPEASTNEERQELQTQFRGSFKVKDKDMFLRLIERQMKKRHESCINVASQSGVNPQTIQKFLEGHNAPRFDTLNKIMQAVFRQSAEDMLSDYILQMYFPNVSVEDV